uniref:cold-inducible RNA-binding protein isoform X1 n=1 Tax=Ictidomys tridecemlineatus TaxID=43179 RepID=UPI001A9EC5BB|nr:cold-inducible RNA-binding protein isoform X1 [Ictidomys tridecemlineatus]
MLRLERYEGMGDMRQETLCSSPQARVRAHGSGSALPHCPDHAPAHGGGRLRTGNIPTNHHARLQCWGRGGAQICPAPTHEYEAQPQFQKPRIGLRGSRGGLGGRGPAAAYIRPGTGLPPPHSRVRRLGSVWCAVFPLASGTCPTQRPPWRRTKANFSWAGSVLTPTSSRWSRSSRSTDRSRKWWW